MHNIFNMQNKSTKHQDWMKKKHFHIEKIFITAEFLKYSKTEVDNPLNVVEQVLHKHDMNILREKWSSIVWL